MADGPLFPLVSVVIATYNQAKYLVYAIESVINQSYPNLELIVVDDGSTDSTPAVVARYTGHLSYIRQANSERGAARNRGLAEARGDLVAFLDADDIWLPHKLMKEVQCFHQHPNAGFVYSDREYIDADGQAIGRGHAHQHRGWVTAELLQENFVCLSANLMRRDAIVKVGGFPEDPQIAGCEDWVAWTHLSTVVQFAHLPLVTVSYRIHSANTMHNAPVMESAMANAMKVIESADWLKPELRRNFSRMRANRALLSAINYCSAGNRKTTFRYLWTALKSHLSILLDARFFYTLIKNTSPSVAGFLRAKRRKLRAEPS